MDVFTASRAPELVTRQASACDTSRMNIRLPLVLVTACLLTACGNKGPLVLPQKPVPVETTPAAQPATPAPSTEASQSQPATPPATEPAPQEPPANPAPKP